MRGSLIVFEGLDQSGKQTQAELLRAALVEAGRSCELLSFPAYDTAIGSEIHRALHGEREYTADVMQLLYVANRYELKPAIESWLAAGRVVLSDRYAASTVAYGVAQGLDAGWLSEIQRFLPAPDLTILLDITPDVAVARKQQGRDRYERDLDLLHRVRDSYRTQAAGPGWVTVPAAGPRDEVTADVRRAVASRLGLP
jgi:dTMP kinase